MTDLTRASLKSPYLVMLGDETRPTFAKTGFGIVHWRPERVAGQLRFPGCTIDIGVPDMSIAEAAEAGVKSLIVGVAPIGGVVPDTWMKIFMEAARAGIDLVSGLHIRLSDFPELVETARQTGAQLHDLRIPPGGIPVGTGKKRAGLRLLTVAGDCAIGKKYSALSIDRAMRKAGMNSTFRATGQTGIMITGEGIPIDSVVSDFISGAAEILSPENDPNHWDVIEGQGSLFHPAYSGVSLGLLHGSQPDVFVVCHDATRKHVFGWEHYAIPELQEIIDTHVALGKRTNPAIRCAGITVNTSGLERNQRSSYLAKLSDQTGLPCADPMIDGTDSIAEHIKQQFKDH